MTSDSVVRFELPDHSRAGTMNLETGHLLVWDGSHLNPDLLIDNLINPESTMKEIYQLMITAKPLTLCAICGNEQAETPADPDIDPTCSECQTRLAEGYEVRDIKRVVEWEKSTLVRDQNEIADGDAENGPTQARWDYDTKGWIYDEDI